MRFISITTLLCAVIGTAAAIESFTTDGDNNLVEMPFPRGSLNASDSGKTVPGPSSIKRDAEENEIAIGEETGPSGPQLPGGGPLLPEGGPQLPEITLPEIKLPEVTGPNMSAEMVEIDTEEPSVPKLELLENTTTSAERPNPNKSGLLRCQHPVTKLFMPNARVCKDERGPKICETLFSPPDETTGRRDPRCDLPGMEDISNTCRRQCAICCEHIDYSCEDDDSGLIDCAKNLEKCTNSRWFDALSKYCAGSCGLCQRTSCRDAVSDCLPRKAICTDPNHRDLMKKQCARTCGFCQVGSIGPVTEPADSTNTNTNAGEKQPEKKQCVDLASNCAARSNLCENTLYAEYMARYCAKTCGKCDSQPGPAARPSACKDSNAECDKWVSDGLCTNKLYSVEYKRSHCAYSCKLC